MATGPTSRRSFARHYAEMVVVMLLGMGLLEGVAALAFAAAGGSLSDQASWLRVMLMGLSMTLPMVAWMRYRGHPGRRNLEMAASMMVPTFVAAALAAGGALGAGAALAVQHSVMFPAMLGVMLWRYDEYAREHRPRRGPEAPPAVPGQPARVFARPARSRDCGLACADTRAPLRRLR